MVFKHTVLIAAGCILVLRMDGAMPLGPTELLEPVLRWDPEGFEVSLRPGNFGAADVMAEEGDWGIPEEPVFLRSMTSVRPGGREYEVRIGKGSQVYSIRTPAGEFIAPQKPHSAEWVDEVLQTVSLNRGLLDRRHEFVEKQADGETIRVPQKPDAYFIHQAGTYNRDLEYPGTFYSPLLAALSGEEDRSYTTLVWPQQAHVPSNHRSHMLVYQRVRWVEPGVFEVTNILHNFGEVEQDWMNFPWVGLRKQLLRHQYLVEPDGSWRLLDHVWGAGRNIGEYPVGETGGAVVFATAREPRAEAMALIFGVEDEWIEPLQWRRRRGQHGGQTFLKVGSTINRGEQNLQVATVIGQVSVRRHEALAVRYFVALGNKAEINRAVARYRDRCFRMPFTHPAAPAGVPWTVPDGESLTLYPTPAGGKVPLFLLEDRKTGARWKTTDPYLLSSRPHDGRTKYSGLAGFIAADDARAWKLPSP